ncbi:hypothetical protein Tco_0046843 [Tanacetum coccineum]
MSNTNNNLQTQTLNALHNTIMEAGGKDRPPMLAPDNYNPPYKFKWTEKTVPVAEGSSERTTKGYIENYKNVSQDIWDQLNDEAEVVQIILTGIDNDIYSTVDACPNACEMWKAIERLKQGESINVQDLETNLYWEFGKFTSRDGESLESYYSRFYKMMNELVRNKCDVTNHQVNVQFLLQLQPEWQRFVTLVKQSQELKTVSYHKLYDILKQHQNEVNELRAERLARTANPLALVAQQQLVYHPQNHPNHYTQNSSTRSQQAATRNRGKAIVNSPPPTYDQEPTMVAEDDEMSKEKEIDKLMALISLSFKKIYKPTNNNLRTSSNTSRANQDNTPRINRGTGYDNQRVVNVAGARENVGTQVVQQSGIHWVQLKAEQADWTDDLMLRLFAKPEFLKKAQRANPRLYDIGCYNDNLALMLAPDSDETIRLDKERRSKLSDLIRPFDYAQLNNLYDWFVPQREKSAEQHHFPKTSKMCHTSSNKEFSKESFRKQSTLLEKRMDESIPWDQKCKSSKELFKIKKSVDTIFDGVERCKQTIAKRTYFGNIDPFIQNTIEGNFGPQISKINVDLERFHLCLKEEMVADLKYVNSLEDEVDNLKSQMETQKTQFLNEIDRLSREYYYADHMNAILGIYTDLDEFTDLQCDYGEERRNLVKSC